MLLLYPLIFTRVLRCVELLGKPKYNSENTITVAYVITLEILGILDLL